MNIFHHILVPLDGSSRAEQAIPLVAHIARGSGARVTLARVLTPLPEPATLLAMGMPVEEADMQQAAEREAGSYLLQMKAAASFAGIKVTIVLLHGTDVAAELEAYADNEHMDLIVLCSRGASTIKRWLFGSVAQDILRISAHPLLIIHEGTTIATEEKTTHPFCVLVALDGSARAETALLPAAALSSALSTPQHGRLHLLHIVRPALSDEDAEEIPVQCDARALAEARDYLSEVTWCIERGRLAPYDLRVTSEAMMEADIVQTLLAVAEQGQVVSAGNHPQSGYDALAITTHGRHGLPRWLLGSRAEHLLSATHLPLLIIRQPHADPTITEQYSSSDERAVTGM